MREIDRHYEQKMITDNQTRQKQDTRKLYLFLCNYCYQFTTKCFHNVGKRQSIVSSRKDSFLGHDPTTEEEDSESDEDSGGSDNEEKQEKRTQRELKLLQNKLRSYKNKVDNARKERIALKNLIKKYQEAMKDEKKKHKLLQKEVSRNSSVLVFYLTHLSG